MQGIVRVCYISRYCWIRLRFFYLVELSRLLRACLHPASPLLGCRVFLFLLGIAWSRKKPVFLFVSERDTHKRGIRRVCVNRIAVCTPVVREMELRYLGILRGVIVSPRMRS